MMNFDTQVKLAVYLYFAETAERPTPQQIADRIKSDVESIVAAFGRLRTNRMLVLEEDGLSIRMASPFSGVPTQHVVEAEGRTYYANCAWDALGIIAALRRPGIVHSRCEQTGEPFHLPVGLDGPEPSEWLFHSLVPATRWWEDIIYT
jgi:hypothetical protein